MLAFVGGSGKGGGCGYDISITGLFLRVLSVCFDVSREDVGQGQVIVFVMKPVFVVDLNDEGCGVNGSSPVICLADLLAQSRDKAAPLVVLGHEVEDCEGKLTITHLLKFEAT
jgi:hypothetical protein